jgi:hypothetical protein
MADFSYSCILYKLFWPTIQGIALHSYIITTFAFLRTLNTFLNYFKHADLPQETLDQYFHKEHLTAPTALTFLF